MGRRGGIPPGKVRAGTWGDRKAERPPYYVQINNRVVTPEEFHRQKQEFMRGAVIVVPPDEPTFPIGEICRGILMMFGLFALLWFVLTFLR
ncbi:hypothetical protein [Phage ST231]|nr:hypothetical protein [Phage ST231]